MNNLLIYIIVSLLCGLICFLSTTDILLGVLVLAIYILVFILLINKKFVRYNTKIKRFHSCYLFINNYIVALSIKKSLKTALETTSLTLDDDFNDLYKSITQFDEIDKLKYFSNFYKFDVYNLFVDVIRVWCDEGGDILSMTHNLSNYLRENEEFIVTCQALHKKRLTEFIILWSFSFAILLILRFALSQFYSMMVGQIFFKIGIFAIFIFALLSFFLAAVKVTSIELKGWFDDEK